MSLKTNISLTLLAGLLLPGLTASSWAVVSVPTREKAVRRLPTNTIPSSYDLHLSPDLNNGKFSGSETISFKISNTPKTDNRSILLHAHNLEVLEAKLVDAPNAVPARITMLPADEMVSLSFAKPLSNGEHSLKLTFRGKLNEKLVGFYRSTFKDAKGISRSLAVTQFEPTDARRMFPCFDEPQLKAKFKLQIRARKDLIAITNGALQKEVVDAGGMKTMYFVETPPMSTYLVAVIVGPLEGTAPVLVDGVPVRAWSIPGKSDLGIYARDEAVRLLPYFTDYFKVPYAWKKLDLIAIPDFEAGAMENPAAITFRQTLLLVNPKSASSQAKRAVTSVLAHEMAHLWFGDLVTMKWWDDLWLNEAFATFMSIHAVDYIHPEWQFWKDFAGARRAALSTDSLRSTRAIHSQVTNPDQAHEMFDVITYEKGSSILRMLERYVGESLFQEGIHQYLQKHAFANATTADLWAAITNASGKPVQDVMAGYIQQPGYPLITVEPDKTNEGLLLSQARFFSDGTLNERMQRWMVPIGLRTLTAATPQNRQSEPTSTVLLTEPVQKTKVAAVSTAFIANAGGIGYYRVHYPSAQFRAIAEQASTGLDPSERLAFLDDAWAQARNGSLPLTEYLSLLPHLQAQSDQLVWRSIINQLNYLDDFVSVQARPAFQRLIRLQLATLQARLGWAPRPTDDQETRILRATMLMTLGIEGNDPAVIAKARRLFEQGVKTGRGIDPDLMDPVTEIVAYNGGAAEYAAILELRKAAKTPEEEIRNLYALTQFAQADLYRKTVSMSIDGTVRTQDAPHLIGSLLGNRRTQKRTWQFINSNWPRISSFYPEEMLPRVVSHASSFNTPEMIADLTRFFASHPLPSGKSTVARTLEQAKINAGFRTRSAKLLNEWLLKNYQPGVR